MTFFRTKHRGGGGCLPFVPQDIFTARTTSRCTLMMFIRLFSEKMHKESRLFVQTYIYMKFSNGICKNLQAA